MIVCGIDPGTTGAVAFIHPAHGLMCVEDLPVKSTGGQTIKNRIDACGFADLIRRYVPADESALFAIEDAPPFGKSTLSSASLEASKATIQAVLDLGRFDSTSVRPQAWKKLFGIGSDKDEALNVARTIFGMAGFERKKDHNRAEAALIAHYARKVLA